MNEVTKLYENAGIEKKEKGYCDCDYMNCPNPDIEPCGKECCYWVDKGVDYPPFTAEKQLELIKWLAFRDYISIVAYIGGEYHSEHDKYNADENSLEDCLARLVNTLWQDLTEEERKQIKEILE